MAEDFFQETEKEPEKIKIGEREFTQDELNKRLELSDKAIESEERYNRPIEKFWPEFTKSQQELNELRKKVSEFENFQQRITSTPQYTPSPEQIKEQAIKQAEELGLMHSGNVRDIIREEIQATRLLDEIEGMKTEAVNAGKPNFTTEELLNHMQETGIKSPEKAYKDKFENELRAWEQKQLATIKPAPFETQETSTAGSKEPVITTPKNEDELQNALRSYLQSERGAENA